MEATEIIPLTEEALARLLAGREAGTPHANDNGRRKALRWPFPGTVEMWLPDENGVGQLTLATCLNLGRHGLGILYEEPVPVGLEFAIAIHQPEASFHGRAVVRHCTENDAGYFIGAQFLFDET